MNPFCAKNIKTNYNVMPYGDHGTERVNRVHEGWEKLPYRSPRPKVVFNQVYIYDHDTECLIYNKPHLYSLLHDDLNSGQTL